MHVSFQAWNEGEDPRGSRGSRSAHQVHPARAEVERLLSDGLTPLYGVHGRVLALVDRLLGRDGPDAPLRRPPEVETALRAAYAEAWHAGQRAALNHVNARTCGCVCVTEPARDVEPAETASELLDRAVAQVRSQVGASANVTATLYVSVDTDGPSETDEDVRGRG